MKEISKVKSPWVISIVAAAFCLTAMACSSEEPLPIYPETGTPTEDGIRWPDYGSKDFGVFPKDRTTKKDTEPSDGGVDGETPDAGNCTHVTANCSATCGAKEYCTESAGGTCVTLATLAGDSTKKEVILDFLLSMIPCWKQEPSESTICATLDTCQMDGDLTAKMVTDWMCDDAQILDFPSSADYDAGRDICGCGMSLNDMDWQISVIRPGEKGKICVIYETTSLDEIFIDECKNFPY